MAKDEAPKSAYEITLEKLRRQDRERGEEAQTSLSDEQKSRIAEIRRRHEAHVAEREILFRSERAKAAASGDPEALEKIEKEYARERERIEVRRDREIAQARAAAGGAPAGPAAGGGAALGGPAAGGAGKPRRRVRKGGAALGIAVLGLSLLA